MVLPSPDVSGLGGSSAALRLARLLPLMARTSGSSGISIGLIDGPVAINHADLAAENIHEVPGKLPGTCADASDSACTHGTFVAGILLARRGSAAPAICPGCSLLVRPIFAEAAPNAEMTPSATAGELAEAIVGVVDAGARVVNLSAALEMGSSKGERTLQQALDHAVRRGVVIVAAAGNQGALGSSAITRHPWVIPVVAYNVQGRPMALSNLGASIGKRGLGALGEEVISLGTAAEPMTSGGTSVATPFVTGAIGLLWSCFPDASAADIKLAVSGAALRRYTIVPPLLDAESAYQALALSKRSISA
jgi:subtilisin family serine protease